MKTLDELFRELTKAEKDDTVAMLAMIAQLTSMMLRSPLCPHKIQIVLRCALDMAEQNGEPVECSQRQARMLYQGLIDLRTNPEHVAPANEHPV